MSLSKAIKSGKEHRKEYGYKKDFAKLVSPSCRNHGSCDWCKSNRLYCNKKRKLLGSENYEK